MSNNTHTRIVISAHDQATTNINKVGMSLKQLAAQAVATGGAMAVVSKGIDVAFKAGTMSIRAFVNESTRLIDAAATFERLQVSLRTVTGSASAAGQAMEWVRTFARDTPYSLEQTANAFLSLTAYGLDARNMLGSISDAAGAMNRDLDEAVLAVINSTNLVFVNLKRFGVLARQEGESVRLVYNDLFGNMQVEQIQKTQQAIATGVVKIFARFEGGTAAQSRTWTGMMNKLRDNMQLFRVQIMQSGPFQILSKGLEMFLADLTSAEGQARMKTWAETLGEALARALEGAFKIIPTLLDQLGIMMAMLVRIQGRVTGVNPIKDAEDKLRELQVAQRAVGVQKVPRPYGGFADYVWSTVLGPDMMDPSQGRPLLPRPTSGEMAADMFGGPQAYQQWLQNRQWSEHDQATVLPWLAPLLEKMPDPTEKMPGPVEKKPQDWSPWADYPTWHDWARLGYDFVENVNSMMLGPSVLSSAFDAWGGPVGAYAPYDIPKSPITSGPHLSDYRAADGSISTAAAKHVLQQPSPTWSARLADFWRHGYGWNSQYAATESWHHSEAAKRSMPLARHWPAGGRFDTERPFSILDDVQRPSIRNHAGKYTSESLRDYREFVRFKPGAANTAGMSEADLRELNELAEYRARMRAMHRDRYGVKTPGQGPVPRTEAPGYNGNRPLLNTTYSPLAHGTAHPTDSSKTQFGVVPPRGHAGRLQALEDYELLRRQAQNDTSLGRATGLWKYSLDRKPEDPSVRGEPPTGSLPWITWATEWKPTHEIEPQAAYNTHAPLMAFRTELPPFFEDPLRFMKEFLSFDPENVPGRPYYYDPNPVDPVAHKLLGIQIEEAEADLKLWRDILENPFKPLSQGIRDAKKELDPVVNASRKAADDEKAAKDGVYHEAERKRSIANALAAAQSIKFDFSGVDTVTAIATEEREIIKLRMKAQQEAERRAGMTPVEKFIAPGSGRGDEFDADARQLALQHNARMDSLNKQFEGMAQDVVDFFKDLQERNSQVLDRYITYRDRVFEALRVEKTPFEHKDGEFKSLDAEIPNWQQKLETVDKSLKVQVLQSIEAMAPWTAMQQRMAQDTAELQVRQQQAIMELDEFRLMHEQALVDRHQASQDQELQELKEHVQEQNRIWFEDYFNKLEQRRQKDMQDAKALTEATAQGMQSAFQTFFFDAMRGEMKSFMDYFKMFANTIIQEIARIQAAKIAAQIMANVATAWVGAPNINATAAQASAAGFGKVIPKTDVPAPRQFADGGIASGPRSGYPATLHGTEAVIPLPKGRSIPVEMRGGSNQAPPVVVQVINQTKEPVEAHQQQPRFDGKQWVVGIVLEAIGRNDHGMADMVRGAARA